MKKRFNYKFTIIINIKKIYDENNKIKNKLIIISVIIIYNNTINNIYIPNDINILIFV